MDEGARGWLAKTARKNYWRVSRWYDLDDLIQLGYECYYEVLHRYPDATAPQHRMALFKRVFLTRITDLANQRTRAVGEVCLSDMFADTARASSALQADTFLDSVAAEPEMSLAGLALESAPQYVKDALALFTTEVGRRRLRAGCRKTLVGGRVRRETFNEQLCRLTGYDPAETDIVGTIRARLTK